MAQEYKNKGPIYTTQAKYEAARTAGTLETGREYRIVDWEAQEKLVSGTSIKTINSQSLLGEGNIEVKTFQIFPTDFKVDGTLQELLDSINDSTGAIEGMGYLGSIEGECTPFGYGNAECKVEYMADGGPALLTVSSSNMMPYYWVLNSWSGEGWTKFSYVEGNPSSTGDVELTKLLIDGTTYNLPDISGKADKTYVDSKIYPATQIKTANTYTTTLSVGNLPAGTVIPAETTLESLIKKILVGDEPVGTQYMYYGKSTTLPTTVEGLTSQAVTRENLLSEGTIKQFTTTDEYIILALDKALNIGIQVVETTTFGADLECVAGYGGDADGKGYDHPYETANEYIWVLPKSNGTYAYGYTFKALEV